MRSEEQLTIAEVERRRETLVGALTRSFFGPKVPEYQRFEVQPELDQVISRAVVRESDGTWSVGGEERGHYIVDHRFATEGAAAEYIWDEMARAYIESEILRPDSTAMQMRELMPASLMQARAALFEREYATIDTAVDTRTEDSPALRRLARDSTTPQATLETLCRHEHYGVRWAAAGNASLPSHIVTQLCAEADFGMRWHLAYAHDLPASLVSEWERADPWIGRLLTARARDRGLRPQDSSASSSDTGA